MRGLSRFGEHVDEVISQSREILQLAEKEEYEAAVHHLALMNHAGGESSKEMSELDGDSPTINFRVVDSGIGMSEEQKSRLIRPFTQADYSTTRKFGGAGLGLTISKTLVNLMGGEISVSSVPGPGSCFEFSQPTGSLENVEIIADPSEVNIEGNVDEPVGVEVATNVAVNVCLPKTVLITGL